MDFHSLSRSSLQHLCKKNKIPANKTNAVMADALHSLPTVEGLTQFLQDLQTPIMTPARRINPTRSCRRNSPPPVLTPPLDSKLMRVELEEPECSNSKRSRTISPRRIISRKNESIDGKEACSIEKVAPLSNHCLRRHNCSGVRLEKCELGCSPRVRENADAVESAGLAVGEERRRSVGIQVDVIDLDNCFVEISAIGDPVPRLTGKDKVAADNHSLEFNQFLDIFKKDQESTSSHLLLTSDILNKECAGSSGMQSCQVAPHLSEPTPECLNIQLNSGNLIGEAVIKSREPNGNSSCLALNCSQLLEDITGNKMGFVGNQDNLDHVKMKDEEFTNSQLLCTNLINGKQFTDSLGLQNVRVASHCLEPSPESSSCPLISVDFSSCQQRQLLEITEPAVKSHKSGNNIESCSLNCGPLLEDSEDEKCEFVDIHSNLFSVRNGHNQSNKTIDKECTNCSGPQDIQVDTHLSEICLESLNIPSNFGDHVESQQSPLLGINNPVLKPHESSDGTESLSSNHCPLLLDSLSEKRMLSGTHCNLGNGCEGDREVEEAKNSGGMGIEIKTEKQSEEKRGLSGMSLRKLRLLCKKNREVIKAETEGEFGSEEKVGCEEKKQSVEKARLDGISLRKLKFLYKNKVASNGI